MFGSNEDEEYTKELIAAMRKRLMDEVASGRGSEKIVNNVYGSSPTGLMDRLYQDHNSQETAGEDPYEYFVDIDRDDKLDDEGNKIGWSKSVRRYRDKKKVKTM